MQKLHAKSAVTESSSPIWTFPLPYLLSDFKVAKFELRRYTSSNVFVCIFAHPTHIGLAKHDKCRNYFPLIDKDLRNLFLFAQHERALTGSGTAKGKGVYREVEAEGSRRQTVGPMNKNLVEGWKAGAMLQRK